MDRDGWRRNWGDEVMLPWMKKGGDERVDVWIWWRSMVVDLRYFAEMVEDGSVVVVKKG